MTSLSLLAGREEPLSHSLAVMSEEGKSCIYTFEVMKIVNDTKL